MWETDSRSETQVKRAIELFEQTGAIERSRGRIADLWNESKTAIETLSLSEYHESLLIEPAHVSCQVFTSKHARDTRPACFATNIRTGRAFVAQSANLCL